MRKKEKAKEKEREIGELRERIKKLEEERQEKKEEKESIVSSVLGGIIPGLGKIVKTFEKASPEFRKRIEETDEQIKRNLERGVQRKTHITFGYRVRPIIPIGQGYVREAKKEEEPNTMLVWERVPAVERKEIKIYPRGKSIFIEIKGKHYKEIPLPFYVKKVEATYERGKKEGILGIKIEKR